MLERRTENLLKALMIRQQNSRSKGCVDMSCALQQWSHDVTVSTFYMVHVHLVNSL